MDVRVLDGFGVRIADAEIDLGGRKPRTLLALLAAYSPAAVSVDRCIQAVWGEDAPVGAKRSLQTYVSSLRAVIDSERMGRLEGSDDGYRLVLTGGDTLDLVEFRRLAATTDADRTAAREALDRAVQLWSGDPLGDLAYDDWAQPYLRVWRDERLEATERWADCHLAAGNAASIVADLESLAAEHPLNEGLAARLMTALYQTGRQTEALETYRALVTRLGEELGLDPGPELSTLEERILLHDPTLLARRPVPTNLPPQTKELLGRDDETLTRLLTTTRLLTITGAGGTGKTTTARELAAGSMEDFPDGVWWFGLAALADGSVLPNEMLGAMRLPAPVEVPPLDSITRRLSHERSLLVFDNCEHLVEPVSDIVTTVLRACPNVTVLTTSREHLAVAGEVSWRLPTLSVPAPGAGTAEVAASESGRLFALRAADPQFEINDANASRVGAICRLLDGLPLALELAAARLGAMGLGELEGRLEDRFTLLTGASQQRTLRETVDWSYDLLTSDEQRLYCRLSVFRGGFDLGAADALFGSIETVHYLDSLVAQSLVDVDHSGVAARYSLLETIRQHAHEELTAEGAVEEAQDAHLRWMAALVGEGARHLEGPDQQTWIVRFRRETDNVRAALSHALDRDPVTGAALASGLTRFWWVHAMERDPTTLEDATSFLEEGHRWATTLLERGGSDLPPKVKARLLTGLGGLLEIRLGRFDDAIGHLDQAIEVWAATGDPRNEGWALFYRGCAAWGISTYAESHAAFDRSCRLHETGGDAFGLGFAKLGRGFAAAGQDDFAAATTDFIDFSALAEKVGNPNMLAHADDALACLAVMAGTLPIEDRERVPRTILRFRRLSNYACIAHGIHTAAAWLAAEGRLEQAARSLGIAQSICERLTMVMPPHEDRTFIVESAGLDRLPTSVREREFAAGRQLEPEEGIDWLMSTLAVR